MAAAYSLRPRAWPLLLGAAACAAAVALGNWQARRADEKRALGAELDAALKAPPLDLAPASPARDYALKHVRARGAFVAAHTVFLDNRLRHGRPGFEVVTPLRLAGSDAHVMVDRGWMPSGPDRQAVPSVPTPAGEVQVDGLGVARLPHALEAGAPSNGPVRQNLDLGAFAAQTGLRLVPVVIEQRSSAQDGLVREWPRPDVGIEKHESYSLQWYSLAALSAILGAVFAFRRVQPD